MVRGVGAGEMAHHQHRSYAVERIRFGRQMDRLFRRQAEPRHAGIDLQRRRQPPPGPTRCPAPGGDLGQAVQHRAPRRAQAFLLGPRRRSVQHIDRRRRPEHGAQRNALVDMGDEEDLAAGGGERRRHGSRTEAVGIGLDHSSAVGTGRQRRLSVR